ncbi:MAG TPA: hypothetical protein ENJ79_01415 [Gammaproteobacteria bacterium]|nr:hypothetical protein [Gammaproteobacteria bacterium]
MAPQQEVGEKCRLGPGFFVSRSWSRYTAFMHVSRFVFGGRGRRGSAFPRVMFLFGLLAQAPGPVQAATDEEIFGNVYGEDGDPGAFIEGPAWKERESGLPPWPRLDSDELIEIDPGIAGFSYRLFIDPDSVSIGDDRVVRYTLILRSSAGAYNVVYEGLRCVRGMVRQYAVGGRDGFVPVRNSDWRLLRTGGADRLRRLLRQKYLCPPPAPGREQALLRRLRTRAANAEFLEDE